MPLPPGNARNLGPVAGTGADGAIPGIGAADLGEIVQLPDGSFVAVFGDSFGGDKVGAGAHYASVAVPVTFDEMGRPQFGEPLNGPAGGPNPLFIPPPPARGKNTLPAGSVLAGGKTYMMAVGTSNLSPDGGSWLVEATSDPSKGWKPIDGSWRPWRRGAPTQISGYLGKDGKVYVAATSFDRSQGISLYRTEPDTCTDRSTWRPYGRHRWGRPGRRAAPISQGQNFGEISLREVDGKVVLAGFNATSGNVEVRVVDEPTKLFLDGTVTTIVDHKITPQPYGGYIIPGSTLENMNIFVSQWNTLNDAHGIPIGAPYNTQHFIANVKPPSNLDSLR
jgi:Domain of unknown function (DUF4185)